MGLEKKSINLISGSSRNIFSFAARCFATSKVIGKVLKLKFWLKANKNLTLR